MLKRLSLFIVSLLGFALPSFAQGPVVLLGIDAEDGGVGGHGPLSAYTSVVANGIIPNITNGGVGMVVIGSGKSPTDNVTVWFNALAASLSMPITHVNGAANISSQSFSGFAIIAIASSQFQTPSGGITQAENVALTARSGDIANHVNGGGGLFGTSQAGLTPPYGYLGAIGSFTFNFPAQFSNVTPTAAGLAVGITETNLDICCWHDEYLSFPGFLQVLANNVSTGNPCAIGGASVIIVEGITLTPFNAQRSVGDIHEVTATVADNFGNPIVGTNVVFNVTAGPHVGTMGMDVTDGAGQAHFSYTGTASGIDMIQGCFTDSLGVVQCSNVVQVEWMQGCFMITFETEDDLVTPLSNGQQVTMTGNFGTFLTIEGVPSTGLTAAIFDTDPFGPNMLSSDPDLLVDRGNCLILQEDAAQTVAGTYDNPDDDFGGGVFTFLFNQPTTVCSIDLIDIDLDPALNQGATVVLTDDLGGTRTYDVPEGWTEDVSVQGPTGFRTLNLTTLNAQPGFTGNATASQSAGFDAARVVAMSVTLGASGAVDNLAFEVVAPIAPPAKPTVATRDVSRPGRR